MKLAAGEFVRLHDGDDFFHAVEGRQMVLVDQAVFADGPDDGAELALAEMGLAAHPLDFGDDAVDGRLRRVLSHYDDQGGISSKNRGLLPYESGNGAFYRVGRGETIVAA